MNTITDIATTAQKHFDMDHHAAIAAAREYISQIEKLENRTIDEDDLTDEDTDFIIESIRQSQPDTTTTPLDYVAEAAARVSQVEDALTVAREERATAILAAVDAGAPIRQIALAGDVSRQTVYTIRDNR